MTMTEASAMLESCGKHPHVRGAAICRRCGHAWCTTCLVYCFGPKKPPYCMGCAMFAGGVKSSAALPEMPRKQLKAQMKALRASAKAEAKAAAEPTQAEKADEPEDAKVDEAAAYGATDWSTPWWEDRQPSALAD